MTASINNSINNSNNNSNSLSKVYYIGSEEGWGKISIGEANESLTTAYGTFEGKCGDNLFWRFNPNTRTLTISGTGEMWNMVDNDGLICPPFEKYSKDIKTVAIGSGVTSIGEFAFYDYRNLTSITMPATVTSIGDGAFANCYSLSKVYYIGSEEGWGKISIGEANESLTTAYGTFEGKCGDNLFWRFNPNTRTLTISGTGEMWNYYASDDNTRAPWMQFNIHTVDIHHGVTSIGNDAFAYCPATIIYLPLSITSIGNRSFYYCKLVTELTIPSSVTSIGDWALFGCYSLTSITIPSSVISIGRGAFAYCSGLTSIRIPSSVRNINDYVFTNCHSLKSVTIPDSVTSIGYKTFDWCTSLTSVTIGNNVTSIGKYSFYHCSGLTSVTIPNSVTSIEEDAFAYCTGLTSVTIPDSVTSIGHSAFYGCTGLNR